MNLYFDESGNTGENLLDKDQPVFVLVSHNFTKKECEDLLSVFSTAAGELHFKNLKKYSKHHSSLIGFLNNDLIDYSRIKMAYYYKKFALCAHLVDQLAEVYYFNNGLSFYEGGVNIKFANTLYMFTEFFELKEEFNELLALYQIMHRTKSTDAVKRFYDQAQKIKIEFKKYNYPAEFIKPICDSKKYIKEILDHNSQYLIELTLPSITLLCDAWYKSNKEHIDIIHDESKALKYWEETLLALSNSEKQDNDVGYDKRTIMYPLKIKSISHVDSKEHLQIQVADLLGSAFAYFAKNILLSENKEDALAKKIQNSKLGEIMVHPLSPDFNFDPDDYN